MYFSSILYGLQLQLMRREKSKILLVVKLTSGMGDHNEQGITNLVEPSTPDIGKNSMQLHGGEGFILPPPHHRRYVTEPEFLNF